MAVLTVRLYETAKRKLDVKARKQGLNTSEFVRQLLAKELKMKPEEVFDSALPELLEVQK